MSIHASPAPRRNGANHAQPDGDKAPAQEIKYRQDAASYVVAMLAELRQIAGKAGLDKLMNTLDAAYYEAYGALDAKSWEAAPSPVNGNSATPLSASPEKTANSMEPNGA